LSEHFNNNIPKFLFTIQKGSSGKGKYYNFKVKENKKENEIDFSIEPFNIKNEKDSLRSFEKKLMLKVKKEELKKELKRLQKNQSKKVLKVKNNLRKL
jgi:hypothetical protein